MAMIFYQRNRRQECHSTSVGQLVRTFWRPDLIVDLVARCVLSRRVSPCRNQLPSLRDGQIFLFLGYLNLHSILFKMIRDSEFTYWADLSMSSDPSSQEQNVHRLEAVCTPDMLHHLRKIHHPGHGSSRNVVQEKIVS